MHPPPCSSADPVSRPDPETVSIEHSKSVIGYFQGVTKICRLFGPANSALVLEGKIREKETECGRGAGSHWLCTN